MDLLIFQNKRYRRIGFIKNNKLVYYHEDFFNHNKEKGDIFIGEITKIDHKIKAVFVNYGKNKDGFLSFFSIHPKYFNVTDSQYNKIIQELKSESTIKNSHFYHHNNIGNFLKIGQKLLIQVIRNEKEDKGAMLSTFITLKNCFLKYIPMSFDCKVLVGDKTINNNQINLVENAYNKIIKTGSISITNNFNIHDRNLEKEMTKLKNEWDKICLKNQKGSLGDLLYKEQNFINVINNQLPEIQNIIIEGEVNLNQIQIKSDKICVHRGFNIFEDYESQIQEIFSSIIQLPNGNGYLIFENTKACTSIDINTGKNKNYKSIINTNLIAIEEIFRLIKLKNIGGIIILDFIGVESKDDKKSINNAIENAIKNDDQKIDFTEISKFGIVEVCRQYTSYDSNYFEKCSHCENGSINAIFATAEKLLRELIYTSNQYENLELHVSKKISEYLINFASDDLTKIKNNLKISLNILIQENVSDSFYKILQCDDFFIE